MEIQSVRLVAVTKPAAEEIEELTIEEFLAYVARVSNPANQDSNSTAPRLVAYLYNNEHWSPFEMVHLVLEINTTRDIARQILRHRSFAFQEFSQRYAAVTNFSEPREARLQDTKNRQNSIELTDEALAEQWEIANQWRERQQFIIDMAEKSYQWALENGIAKEQARVVLPEGLTMSKLYMAGTLRSWIHYCLLRMGHGTQKEHKKIATEAWELIIEQFPALEQLTNVEEKRTN
jgi:thymidylate synthase (FAD)